MSLFKDKSKILFVKFQQTKNANPFISIQNKKLANPRLLNKLLLFPQGDHRRPRVAIAVESDTFLFQEGGQGILLILIYILCLWLAIPPPECTSLDPYIGQPAPVRSNSQP